MNGSKLLSIAILLIGCNISNAQSTSNTSFIKLFNEENLDGWYFIQREPNRDSNLFAVEQGLLHVYPHQEAGSAQSFGALITKKSYSHYILKLEYKWGKKKFKPRYTVVRDAGLLFHVHGPDIVWPNSVECQIQEGDTGDIWLIGTKSSSKVNSVIRNYNPEGKKETRGTPEVRFSRFHRSYCWEVPGWNEVEIEVQGANATYRVNGKVVNEVLDMQYWDEEDQQYRSLTEGKILLQAEGAEIYYRNIYLKELKD